MQKTQSDVSIDAIACCFQSGFAEMGGISTCWENVAACGFRVGFAEMGGISTRGGHVRAFTYDYVKTRPEYPAPHDLSARLISQAQTSSFNFTNFTNLMTIASVLSKTSPALGSSSFITDATGYATQHLQYLPFGETFVDQQNGYDSRYSFSAKEKDDETQYSYFGARYYDSDLSVWLSVDPMSDKYPHQSPYMYCSGNPVMRIDPNGMWDDWYKSEAGNVIWKEGNAESIEVNGETFKNVGESFSKPEMDGSYSNYYQNYFVSNSGTPMDAKKQVLNSPKQRSYLMSNKSNLPLENKIDLMKNTVSSPVPDMQAIQVSINGYFAGGGSLSISAGRVGDDAFFSISVSGGVGGDISGGVSYVSGTYYGQGDPNVKSLNGPFVETNTGAGTISFGAWANYDRMPAGQNDNIGNVWRGYSLGGSFGSPTVFGHHTSVGNTWAW